MARYTTYEHHGQQVAVMPTQKGQHRQHCLCYYCFRFRPEQPDHCPIAQGLFEFCSQNGITAPVFECPTAMFKPDPTKIQQADEEDEMETDGVAGIS